MEHFKYEQKERDECIGDFVNTAQANFEFVCILAE